MRTMYQLDGCSTCRRTRNEVGEHPGLEIVDIKTDPLTPDQPDHLATLTGTYASLFSRRVKQTAAAAQAALHA